MGVVITICLVCLGTGTDGSTGRKCSRCKGTGRDPGLYDAGATPYGQLDLFHPAA